MDAPLKIMPFPAALVCLALFEKLFGTCAVVSSQLALRQGNPMEIECGLQELIGIDQIFIHPIDFELFSGNTQVTGNEDTDRDHEKDSRQRQSGKDSFVTTREFPQLVCG